MQIQKEQKTNLSEIQDQRAFWISIVTGVTMLIILAIFLLTDSSRELRSLKDVRIFVAGIALSGFMSAWLTRQGKASFGISLILIALYASTVLTSLSISNIGVMFAAIIMVVTFSIMSAVFPSTRLANYANATALILSAWVLFLDIFQPFERVENNTPEITWILAGFMLLVYGVLIIRQLSNYSLRTKLILAFLAVTIIPLVVITFLNDNNTRNALTQDANQALLSAASLTAAELDSFINNNLDTVRTQANLPDIQTYISLPESQRTDEGEQGAEIAKVLSTFARQNYIYISSVAIYDLKGITLADTFISDTGTDKSSRDWFQKAVETGLPYASSVEFSETTGEASLYFSAPVRDTSGKIIGVIRTRYNAAILQDLISANNGLVGASSFPILLNEHHFRLAHGNTPSLIFKSIVPLDTALVGDLQSKRLLPPGSAEGLSTNLPNFENAVQNADSQKFFTAELKTNDNTLEQGAITKMKTQPWDVVYAEVQDEFLAPINTQARANIIFTVFIALAVAGFAVIIAQTLSGPIARLTQTAEAIAGGDITLQAKVEAQDEIGTLAGAFNRMTQQLRDFIGTLEARVAERTEKMERRNLYLALAAEVGQSVSEVRVLNIMLKDAAEIISAFFGLYYVQIYLVNPDETELVLQFGTGKVGAELMSRGHRLPLNSNSVNGRAAITKRSVVFADTAASPTFRPNPLLPNTRSEMAVPLLIGQKLVGVLNMQGEKVGTLNEEALIAFEPMAGLLAVAIQNARLVARTEQARIEVEGLTRRLTRSGWEDYLNAIQQPEQIGFMYANDQITPITDAQQTELATDKNALAAPIAVTGETLGTLVVEMDEQRKSAWTTDLVNTVARQMSQQIENLRLLDSAERYRAEAEQASRRITHEGWRDYMDDNAAKGMSYIYDLKEVRAYGENGETQATDSDFSLPLKVRDETVGRLVVQGLGADDSESRELINAVAERLGAHIESLRLSKQTEQALATTRKQAEREQALRQITSVVRGSTDPTTILRSAARELGAILGRKTIVRLAIPDGQSSLTQPPAEIAREAIANNGNEPASPAESQNAIGGDE